MPKSRMREVLKSADERWQAAFKAKDNKKMLELAKERLVPEDVFTMLVVLHALVTDKAWEILDELETVTEWREIAIYGTMTKDDIKPGKQADGILPDLIKDHPDQNVRVLRLLDTLGPEDKEAYLNTEMRILNEDCKDDPRRLILGESTQFPLLYYVYASGNVAIYNELIQRGASYPDLDELNEYCEDCVDLYALQPTMLATRFNETPKYASDYFLQEKHKVMLRVLLEEDTEAVLADINYLYIQLEQTNFGDRKFSETLRQCVLLSEMLKILEPKSIYYETYCIRLGRTLITLTSLHMAAPAFLNINPSFSFRKFFDQYKATYFPHFFDRLVAICVAKGIYVSSVITQLNDDEYIRKLGIAYELYSPNDVETFINNERYTMAIGLMEYNGSTLEIWWEKLLKREVKHVDEFLAAAVTRGSIYHLENPHNKFISLLNEAESPTKAGKGKAAHQKINETDKKSYRLNIARQLMGMPGFLYSEKVFQAIFQTKAPRFTASVIEHIFSKKENHVHLSLAIRLCDSEAILKILLSYIHEADSNGLFNVSLTKIAAIFDLNKSAAKPYGNITRVWLRKYFTNPAFLSAVLPLPHEKFRYLVAFLTEEQRSILFIQYLANAVPVCKLTPAEFLNITTLPTYINHFACGQSENGKFINLAIRVFEDKSLTQRQKDRFLSLIPNHLWPEALMDWLIASPELMETENVFRTHHGFLAQVFGREESVMLPAALLIQKLMDNKQHEKILRFGQTCPRVDVGINTLRYAIKHTKDEAFIHEAKSLIKSLKPEKPQQAPRHDKAKFLAAYNRTVNRQTPKSQAKKNIEKEGCKLK